LASSHRQAGQHALRRRPTNPIITPTAVRSRFCKFEFETFLAREKELGRSTLVFPILYIPVPALADDGWRQDPLLATIGSRQYEQWQNLRHLDPSSTEVAITGRKDLREHL
jgi:hypothetical protein